MTLTAANKAIDTAAGWKGCDSASTHNGLKIGTNTINMQCKWGEAANEDRSFMIDMMVSLFSAPCKNKNEYPSGDKTPWQAVINQARADCSTSFGPDNFYSVLADKQTLAAYFTGSPTLTDASVGTELYKAYTTSTKATKTEAQLYGRYQIETKCKKSCQDFRFTPVATKLKAEMQEAYNDLDTLCLVSGFGGVLCMVALLLVTLQKKKAKQSWYFLTVAMCLMVAFVCLILFGLFIYDLSYTYWSHRNEVNVHADCITNGQWRALPK